MDVVCCFITPLPLSRLLWTGMFSMFLCNDHLSKHSVCFKWLKTEEKNGVTKVEASKVCLEIVALCFDLLQWKWHKTCNYVENWYKNDFLTSVHSCHWFIVFHFSCMILKLFCVKPYPFIMNNPDAEWHLNLRMRLREK